MAENTNKSNLSSPPKSTFITVLAWVFISIGGFATLISVAQAIMFAFVFPADFVPPASAMPEKMNEMPALFKLLAQNPLWFFAFFWSICVVTFVSALGLLRRRNWARLVFIGLMAFGIVWNLTAIWLQGQMMAAFPQLPPDAPPEFNAEFETMMTIMRYVTAAFVIAFSVVFAWIIRRLVSRTVRAEFNAL